jgi:hypothetical protein
MESMKCVRHEAHRSMSGKSPSPVQVGDAPKGVALHDDCAKATGQLAQTDGLDAGILAHFADAREAKYTRWRLRPQRAHSSLC